VDNFYLSAIVREVLPELRGRTVSRVSIIDTSLLIDFRLTSDRELLISMDRSAPAMYLSLIVAAQLSPPKSGSTFFGSLLRKHLEGGRCSDIRKQPGDRVLEIDFENVDAGDNPVRLTLRLALTGRSSNAYLYDDYNELLGTLFDASGASTDALADSSPSESGSQIDDLPDDATESELLSRFFGRGSMFSPQLKIEFLARCKHTTPAKALRSLYKSLLVDPPLPLIYSSTQLDEVGERVINPANDLLLSHIELTHAQGRIRNIFSSLSEAADRYENARQQAIALRSRYGAVKQNLERELSKRRSTLAAIEADRVRFENPDRFKRYGDLILANLANARMQGNRVSVIDYYDDEQPTIEIDVPEGSNLQSAAADYFARYQKARRAIAAIDARATEVSRLVDPLNNLLINLEGEPTADSVEEVSRQFDRLVGSKKRDRKRQKSPQPGKGRVPPGRRFISSDGFEIVVGRNDRDNDAITFRVARPHEIWLHAADYPGSHTLIRNPSRVDLPHKTITEAAELAAFYSQAKGEGKAAVHYTQKKFVSKPPRAKPGLVRLSSFKTIFVEPRCTLERIP
jgi:predicted ribosome quality control (RQC) complex YloA/Tae2 family protein